MIRVAVVDDQQLVREGFALILGAQRDFDVTLQCADGRSFVDAVQSGRHVDVALVDIRMPVLDGLQATRLLAGKPGSPAIVVVTTFDDDALVIDAIAAGGADLSRYRLTPREADILALIGAGMNNTEIAAELYLSPSTVKTHVSNVLAKSGSRDRVQAALLSIRLGLPDDLRTGSGADEEPGAGIRAKLSRNSRG